MKKIALVVLDLDRFLVAKTFKGGGGHVAKRLLQEWILDDRVELDVICVNATIESYDGINKIITIPYCPNSDYENFIGELKKHAASEKYDDVVFAEHLLPFGTSLLHSHSYLYRYGLYNCELLSQFFKIIKRKKIDAQKKLFSTETKSLIAMSEKIKKDYSSNFCIDETIIKVAFPGVEIFENVTRERKSDFVFGLVGGGINKGAALFLKAFKKVFKHDKNIKALVITTNEKNLKLLKLQVRFSGLSNNVEFVDYQSNIGDFYKQIDCLVMPSRHEAFGLVAIEAASYKAVPIVSNNTGFAELVADGQNGFIFDINKNGLNNLAKSMSEVINIYQNDYDRFEQIRDNAFGIAKEYTWKRFADTILESL